MNSKLQSALFSVILLISFYHWGAYFAATVIALSFLIFFHEFGHFLLARALKVKVNVFSVGFGAPLCEREIKGTKYRLSAIWLGGYVQLKGQDDTKPELKNYDKDSYNTLSPLGRIAILFAGPAFNIILAFFLYIVVGFLGTEKIAPVIGSVLENSAAQSAGLAKNDKIIEINGVKISSWDEIKPLISLEPAKVVFERNKEQKSVPISPKIGESKNIFGESIQSPMLGIAASGELVKLHFTGLSSLKFALDETINASKLIYLSLEKLILGVIPINQLGGIVAMADITTKAAQISLSTLLIITALISVNLGVLNLLPLPVLDGGHIAFNLYEMIFRRPANEKFFVYASYASMALLFSLMAFTIINDIYRLAGGYNG